MRVIHLVKTGTGAGWALQQMDALVQQGVEVHVVLPEGPRVRAYRDAGITVHMEDPAWHPSQPGSWRQTTRRLRKIISDVQPDVVHSHFVATTVAMRMALRRSAIPRLFQVPGPLHLEHPVLARAEVASADHRDWWAGSCRWTCREYRRLGVAAKRISLVYYGTDIALYRPQVERAALREVCGFPKDVPLVGMVAYAYSPRWWLGQTRGIKGHEDLFAAMSLLKGPAAAARLVMVGGPWHGAEGYWRHLQELGRRMLGDRIYFLGLRSDIPAVYADLDVVVHPSLSENVGGASESLLCGVPTVATRVGGLPDLVRPGFTGWLAEASDPNSLAEAITSAVMDREEARRRASIGRRLACRLMDVQRNAESLRQLYGRMQENSSGS